MTDCAAQPPAAKPDLRMALAVLTTVFFWASAFVAIRSAGKWFDPGALALGRLATGAATLLVIWLIRQEKLPPRAAWPGIIMGGLLWFALYTVALNWGEQHVDAGTAAMLVNVAPVLTVLLAGWFLKEAFSPRITAGLTVAFLGATVVGLANSSGGSSWQGVGLCLLAAACYALGMVIQKPALRHASAFQITTLSCLTGALACLPFAGELAHNLVAAPLSADLSVVYMGVFPTALAFTTWSYALARTSASKLGVTTYVVPVIVILLSWAVLGEVPGQQAVLGGALCLAGVAVARSQRRPRLD